MAVYRMIQTCFWSDPKVQDEMSYEEKYFYLYLLTNENVNQSGCYKITMKKMIFDTDLDEYRIDTLLKKFEEVLKIIKYDKKTKEILLLNFSKYNWTNSEKVKKCIEKNIEEIKSEEFKQILINKLKNKYQSTKNEYENSIKNDDKNDTVSIGYQYPMDRLGGKRKKKKEKNIYISQCEIDVVGQADKVGIYSEILDYMNDVTAKNDDFKNKMKFNFKNTKNFKKLIDSLLDQDYDKNDIKDVIYYAYGKFIENATNDGKSKKEFYVPNVLFGKCFDDYYGQYNMEEKKR